MLEPLKITFVWFSDEVWNGYTKLGATLPKWISKIKDPRFPIDLVGRKRDDVDYCFVPSTPTTYMVGNRRMIEMGMPRRLDVVYLSMYDATPPPPRWIEIINRTAFFIVPSEWCRTIFSEAGVDIPIIKVPCGVDTENEFPYRERRANSVFTVLVSGLQMFPTDDRKNATMVLHAWRAAGLHKRTDARLIIKMSTGVKTISFGDTPNVQYIMGKLNHDAWLNLMQDADVYVMASSGEGFGLPPLEFMSTGGAVIATDWGGMQEWLGDSPALKLRVADIVPAERYNKVFDGDSVWAMPDQSHLTELLEWCYENRQAVTEKGIQGAAFVRREWTWRHAAQRAVEGIWDAHEHVG